MKLLRHIALFVAFALTLAAVLVWHLEKPPAALADAPTIRDLLHHRVAWPCVVTLTEPHQVAIIERGKLSGSAVINEGVVLWAHDLTADGELKAAWAGIEIRVPMDKTNFAMIAGAANWGR